MTPTPTLLLVHGAWHGPWCWERLLPELAALGLPARTVALPSCTADLSAMGTLDDDAAAVAEAEARIDGPVVAVGHSYAGIVLSHARHAGNVARLVFLGAFMPDTGRSLVSYLPEGPLPPYVDLRGDHSRLVPETIGPMLYGDCDAATQAWAARNVVPHSTQVIAAPVAEAAWHRLPSTYIVLGDDQTVPTPMQRMFAAQAGAIRELPGSHSPFAARPAALAALLGEIVGAHSMAA